MNDIFQKFTDNLKKTIIEAEKIASERHTSLNTEHQLLSILRNQDTFGYEILSGFDIAVDRLELVATLIEHSPTRTKTNVSKDAKRSIQLAVQFAAKYDHSSIGSEHLLLALISNKNFNSYLILERIGIDPKKIKKQIESIFRGIGQSFNKDQKNGNIIENMISDEGFNDLGFAGGEGMPPFLQSPINTTKRESVLESFSMNLTALAEQNKLDPVIGREKEINRMIQTLSRRTKNNPILVGEPGVGKTSIVEGLALRIASGQVPEKIADLDILSLDLGSVLAGTMYRGQFESRIKKILAEIEKRGNVVLFVDEIHMMVGAGSTEGSIDAANLLKPMLSKGKLRLIGSTTFDEYKKHIEKDPAFERRFQSILVTAPSVSETIKILHGIKDHYEQFHHVKYTDEAIAAAATLSDRFINDRSLPDKAIDLIDESGAAVANVNSRQSDQTTILRQLLLKANKKKDDAISKEKYEIAARCREEALTLEAEIGRLNAAQKSNIPLVSEEHIASLISEWTGVPAANITTKERRVYLSIEKTLKKFIIGQDQAISEISKALRRSRTGIANPNRPIGSFMFLGPTGVGKTELAKVLANEIFGREDALVKIDMSEFMEKHNVARLVGAPAGYIGYDEGGKLTEKVRKNPYLVILFDEIEKAHPEVFNILLQIMEDGTLSDAKGRKVDFKNTIIILTSNLGTDILRRSLSIGFKDGSSQKQQYDMLKENVLETVEKTFRPEFINRLDSITVFYPLEQKVLRKIVDLQCTDLIHRLKNQKYEVSVTKKARDHIAQASYTPEFGARPIRKYIAEHVENLLSDAILAEKFKIGNGITVDLKDGKLVLV